MRTSYAIGLGWQTIRPLRHAGLLASAALATVVLPGWLHGVPPAGWWAPLAVLVALFAARYCNGHNLLACLAVVALGLLLDFARVPPVLLMGLCSAPESAWRALLLSHLQMLPITSALMLCLLLTRAIKHPRQPLRAVAELTGMLLAMPLAMELCQRAAVLLGGSWGPDGWACAIATGMIVFELIFRRNVCNAHP